jgi:hypothetical protein
MALTTTVPLALPSRQASQSFHDDRDYSSQGPGPGTASGQAVYYSRPPSSHSHAPSSSHGLTHADSRSQASPERNSSSHSQGFQQPLPDPAQQIATYPPHIHVPKGYPATPVSGPSYAPDNQYEAHQSHDEAVSVSPPDESRGVQNFTAGGDPIVPVGISGGKMFQCKGYGACDKVFTRSEHLARHVR